MRDACPVPECKELKPHEHRRYQYDIATDTHWREVSLKEVEMLNGWRERRGEPPLVFTPVRAEGP